MDKIYPASFSDDYFQSFLFPREEKTTRTNCRKCRLKLYPASYIFRSLAHAILPKMFRFRVNDLKLRYQISMGKGVYTIIRRSRGRRGKKCERLLFSRPEFIIVHIRLANLRPTVRSFTPISFFNQRYIRFAVTASNPIARTLR